MFGSLRNFLRKEAHASSYSKSAEVEKDDFPLTQSLESLGDSSSSIITQGANGVPIVTNYCVHVNTLNPQQCYKEISQQVPISLMSFQPDSYFAASQGYGVTKISTTATPEQQHKKTLKNSIQSTSGEELKERVFQFLKARPAVAAEFLAFSLKDDMEEPRENWKILDGFNGRDWSGEFRQLLSNKDISKTKWQERMYSLSNDFFHAAELYSQVIISELALPVPLKSITPVNIGGLAGGDKYIIGNILFKFAVDREVRYVGSKNAVYMYGGTEKRDDLAMKAAGIEMQNLQAVLANRPENLFVPLMCVIDYLGHRIIASSILPIDRYTLCYGSSDGGQTVHKNIEELNKIMQTLGKNLNLQEHFVGSKYGGKLLYMPGDIEVHRGLDGRYYILDLARLMPPEHFLRDRETYSLNESRKIYYQTLRNELVLGFSEPLSSDAFSGWTENDPNRFEHEQAILRCTNQLYQGIIPNFCEALQSNHLELLSFLPSREQWSVIPAYSLMQFLDTTSLSSCVHYYGINVRHFGVIRSQTTEEKYRDFILINCLARVMKNQLRKDMRELMTKLMGSPTDIPLRDLVLFTCRKINPYSVCCVPDDIRSDYEKYWMDLYRDLEIQFPGCLSPEEHRKIQEEGFHDFIAGEVGFRAILYLFFKFAQVKLSSAAMEHLLAVSTEQESNDQFYLVRSDVERFEPKTRKPYIASLATACLLATEATQFAATGNKNALRMMDLATKQLYLAHMAIPSCPLVNKNLALLYWKTAKLHKRYDSKEPAVAYYFKAIRFFDILLSQLPDDPLAQSFPILLDEARVVCVGSGHCSALLESMRARTKRNSRPNCCLTKLKYAGQASWFFDEQPVFHV